MAFDRQASGERSPARRSVMGEVKRGLGAERGIERSGKRVVMKSSIVSFSLEGISSRAQ